MRSEPSSALGFSCYSPKVSRYRQSTASATIDSRDTAWASNPASRRNACKRVTCDFVSRLRAMRTRFSSLDELGGIL
jgi:hypothetical protein